jgi:hypothetical protein
MRSKRYNHSNAILGFEVLTAVACCLFYDGFLFGLFFDPEDRGDVFLRNNDRLSPDYMLLYPRRRNSGFGKTIRGFP